MEDSMKKLALWHTRTFRPMITHDDLEPIMSSLGFVTPQLTPPTNTTTTTSAVEWKEYAFTAASASKRNNPSNHQPSTPTSVGTTQDRQNIVHPRPRLPFPRIDGLHLLTYRAFIDAVGFYLGVWRVADHFHVRGMPLHLVHDKLFAKEFRCMNSEHRVGGEDSQGGFFVFRDGTLDQTLNSNGSSNITNASSNSNSNSNNNPICLVPLKDIIVYQDITV